MALERHRVAADEQVLVAGEAQHQVAGADPDLAGVGRDADDGGVPVRPRAGVPARPERRVEGEPVLGDLDSGDRGHGLTRGLWRSTRIVASGKGGTPGRKSGWGNR